MADQLASFRFQIEVSGIIKGAFTEAAGLGSEQEVVEHKIMQEGKEIVRKIPGRLKWGDITLKRGITDNMDFWDWRKMVEEGKINSARKNGSIVMMDSEETEIARWNFTAGWPSKVSGPSVSTTSNEIGIEELTVVHEGIERVT